MTVHFIRFVRENSFRRMLYLVDFDIDFYARRVIRNRWEIHENP